MWQIKHNFELNVFFEDKNLPSYIKCHKRYKYTELEKIFLDTDVLIVPSIWYETFGFIVLEALSFGVPVVLSGTVGAKDILADGAGIVVENITVSKLKEVLLGLTQDKLSKMNTAIIEKQHIMVMADFSRQIREEIYMK